MLWLLLLVGVLLVTPVVVLPAIEAVRSRDWGFFAIPALGLGVLVILFAISSLVVG